MKKIILSFSFLLAAIGVFSQSANFENQKPTLQKDSVVYKTFNTVAGWGYDIYINGIHYIHQENIPAVAGNSGFISEEKAKKAAEFIVYKIKNNVFPPSVGEHELDSLGVLK